MKIALVSDCYLPRLGGIEVQVRDLAHQLAAAGHRVEVFTATVGADGARRGRVEVVDGVPVHRLGIREPFGFPVNPVAESVLRRRLGDGGFDVAHVHMGVVSPFTVAATNVAREMGLPATMTWHCMLAMAGPLIGLTGAVPRWVRDGVSMNAVSSVAARPVQRLVGGRGQVRVLPNGIDVERWWGPTAGAPVPPLGPGGRVEIVTAMRLVERKRPLPMLDVLRQVRALVPDTPFRVTILGDGRLRGRIQAYLRRHAMESWVRLGGRVSRETLLERYASSHLYVSPAKLESFGIAALEARCTGLPVVGLSTNGAGEFVHDGVNGFLARDDQAMARAIGRLVADHDLRDRMHLHNVTVAPTELDWSNVVRLTVQEYERALVAHRHALPAPAPAPAGGERPAGALGA
ncbi:glycosyltransferase family 4 protein [Agilicoccus flavus]|uniref:glycosyltransferase family 4 protein n=1 Tax=Agilicoccus flavus TaxID=2775968 RepID=UPI001CF65B83|nr:glycosyltransferase family 4 protein [Agilicoccus flavus]